MQVACLLLGGPERRIRVGGKEYPFELHPQLGPCPVGKRGDPIDLGARHVFWDVVQLWWDQGQRIGADGLCEWQLPPDPSRYTIIKHGVHWADDSSLTEDEKKLITTSWDDLTAAQRRRLVP